MIQHPYIKGLYDRRYEKDACGIGAVVNVNGRRDHSIIEYSKQILINLKHRGAAGADETTGDGAGILLQIPHEFLSAEAENLGFSPGKPSQYGVGMIFGPKDEQLRQKCDELLESALKHYGLKVLGFRDVPVKPDCLGQIALAAQHHIKQVFIDGAGLEGEPLERKLYLVRKRAERLIRENFGTARRQGAKQIYQLEILPKPPETRPPDTPWPMWPRIMRTSTSHEEGCDRRWSVATKGFSGTETRVAQLQCCKVEWLRKNNGWKIKELADTEFTLDADIVLLAMGFLHVKHEGIVKDLDLKLDSAGNIVVNNYQTSEPTVFAAGDSVNGASLVVRAIDSGRKAAEAINKWLLQNPRPGGFKKYGQGD